MAVLKFGAIVTEGSGSLGGHTIQNSKGGMQIRTKPIPRGNPSASQLLIRSINQQLQAGWRALTPSQQKIWNDWPVTHGVMNAKGDHRPLSGHSLWMKYNYYWLKAGGTFLPNPSYWPAPILGPELINQQLWNAIGLGWWLDRDPTWSGDNVKLLSNGEIGGVGKPNLSIPGSLYRSVVDVTLNSGTLLIYHGLTPPVRYASISGIYTTDAIANATYFYMYSLFFNGSINSLSYKQIF